MSGNPYEPSESFTVRTVAGEEIEIVEKISGPEYGERIVLVTAEDQKYVSSEQGGLVEPFNADVHVGGNAATGEAAAKWTETADATDAAEQREALKNDPPADATEAAEAKAALEAELAQTPSPVMGGADGPLPSDVAKAAEDKPTDDDQNPPKQVDKKTKGD